MRENICLGEKGDLSLEYIGKFIIMAVALVVAIGIILTLSNKVGDIFEPPPKCDETEYAKVKEDSAGKVAAKVANLIDVCFKCYENSVEDKTCFVVTKNFPITSDQIASSLPAAVAQKTLFEQRNYNSSVLIISWLAEGKILVKE